MREGTTTWVGVDTETPLKRDGYLKSVVNRTFRNYANKTRPPFVEMNVSFYDEEDENVFRNGSIKGIKFFKGTKRKTNPFIVVCVHDRILAGLITPNAIVFYPAIYKGLSIKAEKAFFCKAEDVLVFQNGVDYPLYWRGGFTPGNPLEQMKAIYESSFVGSSPMMLGKMMVYCHGRIFLVDDNDLVYASDHIYSQGITLNSNEAVLKFSESFYPSSGDGFSAISEMEEVTGICAVKKSGTLTGHGEVFVLCRNGAYSIDPTPVRNQWTAQSIQKTLFIGSGCSAYDSLVNAGEDIFYRDSEGHISSIRFSYSQLSSDYQADSLSQDVDKYLSYDKSQLMDFSKSIFTNGRLLFSTAIEAKESTLGGSHIFSNGLLPVDFKRSETKMRFEGLWTGPRVSHMSNAFSCGVKFPVFTSFDTDGVNRIYTMGEIGDDFVNGESKKIVSFYIQKKLFHSNEKELPISKKMIKTHEFLYEDQKGEFSVESLASPNGSKCFYQLMKPKTFGFSCVEFDKKTCLPVESSELNNFIIGEKPCDDLKQSQWYDVATVIRGNVSIISDIVSAEITKTETSSSCKLNSNKCCGFEEEQTFNNQF